MTISTLTRRAGPYLGNGSAVVFPFGFKIFSPSDLQVQTSTGGAQSTTLSLTTDYTVSINPNQDTAPGGTVTCLVAPAVGTILLILSAIPETQPINLQNQGGLFPETLNDGYDRLVALLQQQTDRSLGYIRGQTGDTYNPLPRKSDMAGRYLVGDVSGNLVPANPPDALIATSPVASITALRAATWAAGRPTMVTLVSNWATGDGGGVFRWVSGSVAADDGGLTIKEAATTTGRWVRQFGNAVDPRWFGLIVSADTATTAGNTTAMQAALDSGFNIVLPDGDFWCGAVTQNTPRQVVMGTKKTRWRHSASVSGLIIVSALATGAVWTGFRIDGNRAAVTYSYNSSEFAVFASDVVLSWLELRDVQSMGIRGLNGAARMKVQNCDVITAGDFGIFINNTGTGVDPAGCLIENCYVEDFGIVGGGGGITASVGIGIRSTEGGSRCINNRIRQTATYTNDQLGIEFWTNSNNCVCSGNTVEFTSTGTGEFGISATGYGMTVSGNTIIGTDSYAIEIVDRAVSCSGNTLRSPRGAGIAINLNAVHTDPGDCITVTGNTIENVSNIVNPSFAGIVVAGDPGVTPTAITITGNTIWGLSRLILVTSLVSGFTITGNTLYNAGSTLTPLVATGSRGAISGNTIVRADVSGTIGAAITVGGSKINVSGNTIAGDGASNRIDNGILINSGATDILIGPNFCTGATNYVFSSSTASSVVVQGGLATAGSALQAANRIVGALNTVDGQSQTANVAPGLGSFLVANLPTTNIQPGQMAYASNGRKNGEGAGSGTGVQCFRDASAWRACDTGATVAA